MAKGSNKNATKSFVMLIVTGVVLVAVTLCWFAINNRGAINSLESSVEREGAEAAKFYIGYSDAENKKVAITAEELVEYGELETESMLLTLDNMVPGGEYFYKAVFSDIKGLYYANLSLEDVENKILKNMIEVRGRLTTSDDEIHYAPADHENTKILQLQSGEDNIIIENFKVDSVSKKTYVIYFSFKFSEDATGGNEKEDGTTEVDYRNESVIIGNVNATLSTTPIEDSEITQ